MASALYLLSGESGHELAEGIEGLACAFGIAFSHVLLADLPQETQVLVKVDQPTQIVDVVHVGVVRMQLDEALARGDRRGGLVVLPVGIGNVDLRLLGITTVGIAGFEFLEVLDRRLVGPPLHRLFGFRVQPVGGPADRFILHFGQ